jgi:PDZ domain-containing secreted protein
MQNSQRSATYVALRAAGYISQARTLFVLDVGSSAPASGLLYPADEIVSVDGKPAQTILGLRKLIRAKRPGKTHVFLVRRGEDADEPTSTCSSSPSREGTRTRHGAMQGGCAWSLWRLFNRRCASWQHCPGKSRKG